MKTEIEKITLKQISLINKLSLLNRKPTSNIDTILKRLSKIMAFTFEIIILEEKKRRLKQTPFPKGGVIFKTDTGEALIKRFENIESKDEYKKRI
jgi:hypothetical protein